MDVVTQLVEEQRLNVVALAEVYGKFTKLKQISNGPACDALSRILEFNGKHAVANQRILKEVIAKIMKVVERIDDKLWEKLSEGFRALSSPSETPISVTTEYGSGFQPKNGTGFQPGNGTGFQPGNGTGFQPRDDEMTDDSCDREDGSGIGAKNDLAQSTKIICKKDLHGILSAANLMKRKALAQLKIQNEAIMMDDDEDFILATAKRQFLLESQRRSEEILAFQRLLTGKEGSLTNSLEHLGNLGQLQHNLLTKNPVCCWVIALAEISLMT
jgi:hypothetical protein